LTGVRRISLRGVVVGYLVVPLLFWPSFVRAGSPPPGGCPAALTAEIPSRPAAAAEGTEFANQVLGKDSQERERSIEGELSRGNLPPFLRRLKPVTLRSQLASGRAVSITLCVMPDYLAIGSEGDFLRIPMDLHTATAVAHQFGFVLPTRKMVNAIYEQSEVHLSPEPMEPGPKMSSTAYYVTHNHRIAAQRAALGASPDALTAGHKKDVVMTNLLARNPGRIAIYGWHRHDGRPIQPLSTVHGASYADYSHGIRLVSKVVFVDGEATSIYRVLEDPAWASVLSDEGPVRNLSAILPAGPTRLARLERAPAGHPEAVSEEPGAGGSTAGAL
jgi:hypothetical protein